MTAIGDKLTEALAKANNTETYVWKGPKVNGVQKEYLLKDCDQETLQKYYDHCKQMLYNKDEKNPGRLVLIDLVKHQIQCCRAELLVRWLLSNHKITRQRCRDLIQEIIDANPNELTIDDIKSRPIVDIMPGIPLEYEQVPISMVKDACTYIAGTFNNSHITKNFILRMGLHFTQKEMQTPWPEGLYKKDPITGKAMNRLELVKKMEGLNPAIMLKVNDNGLTYAEFRSMNRLRREKYELLTSDQLTLLSTKVLYRFQDQCKVQAEQWLAKMHEIEEVAEAKGYTLE